MTDARALTDAALARSLDGDFTSRYADVNGVRLHYVEGGAGQPLILLGGWPQTWWQWHKVMPELARHYRVFAVDLRGMGGSSKPESGYDKKTMAEDVHALARQLDLGPVHLAGHDIGAMVAYAYAANRPEAVGRVALLDVPHPDPNWSEMKLLPGPTQHVDTDITKGADSYLWWFAFNQVRGLPEALLDGRMRLLVDWLFDQQAEDPASLDARSREVYALAYSTADAVRAGNAWYQEFNRDIADFETYEPVAVPLLALGAGANHGFLAAVLPQHGTDVRLVEVKDSGHYIPEEQPGVVVEELVAFLG